MAKQKKDLQISVTLDEDNVPEKIEWGGSDAAGTDSQNIRALLLSMWDQTNKDTLRLDLWTKDMAVDEMKIFFHQTLSTMADTLEKSIQDERIAGDMRDFCAYFAEKMEIIEDNGDNNA